MLHTPAERFGNREHPVDGGNGDLRHQVVGSDTHELFLGRIGVEAGPSCFEASQSLLQGFREGSSDGHGFPDALHRGAENGAHRRELGEVESRYLDDHVVEGRFERCGGRPGDVVDDLVEVVADGQPGRDLGDRETRGFGGESRRTRYAWVHLDDDPTSGRGVDGELHVRTPGGNADRPEAEDGLVAHLLVLAVGQGHGRRHRDAVTRMDPHGIEVLDGAHDHGVVGRVAHDLEFVLLPAEDRLLHEDLRDRRGIQTGRSEEAQFGLAVCDPGPATAQDVRRSHHDRVPEGPGRVERLLHGVHVRGTSRLDADGVHDPLESATILGGFYGVDAGSDQLHVVVVERAGTGQRHRHVQSGLAPDGREERIRTFLADDGRHHLGGDGLDIGGLGELGIGHDGRRIRVDQDDPISLFAEDLHRLGTRVVEFARLADDDRPRTDDEDRFEVVPSRHQAPTAFAKRSNSVAASLGPGAASGWYWTEKAFTSRQARPSSVPSLRFWWVATTRPNSVSIRSGR